MFQGEHLQSSLSRERSRTPYPLVKIAVVLGFFVVGFFAFSGSAGALMRGIDVASWQHPGSTSSSCGRPIDWRQVANSNVNFAYVKSTQGTTYTNPCFAQDWSALGSISMFRGSYHYAQPALPISTAVDQARYFVSRTGPMTGYADLPGMLDLEETGGLNATDLSNWTRAFLDEVTVLTGKKPVLYMGASFFPGTIAPDIPAHYRLWLPSYPCQDRAGNRICDPYAYGGSPRLPGGWTSWTWWQFSSIEQVPGIYARSTGFDLGNVDMNWFCCDLATLRSLAGPGESGGSPFGAFDSFTLTSPTSAVVSGWAIDPDTRDSIEIHTYVDGVNYPGWANQSRPDVGAIYPGFGPNHGFAVSVPITPTTRSVCSFAINVAAGGHQLLRCLDLKLPAGPPFGVIDRIATREGAIDFSGWSIDPDTSGPVGINVVVDGQDNSFRADGSRPDLAAAFPGYGPSHGFGGAVAASPGAHSVCFWAINTGAGAHSLLGCRTVTVPGAVPVTSSPVGYLDAVRTTANVATFFGWALDRDSTGAVPMLFVVDGVWSIQYAGLPRPDIGALFPASGPNHGFAVTMALPTGAHNVCIAIGDLVGGNPASLLGCRNFTIPPGDPFGQIDRLQLSGGRIDVAGWAMDPNTLDPVDMHIYVNGVNNVIVANQARPDVGAAFWLGSDHGFEASLARVGAGPQNVCVYAINVGPGWHRLLGCRTL